MASLFLFETIGKKKKSSYFIYQSIFNSRFLLNRISYSSMSFLESINLFPETRYLRARRTPELNHSCGGLASLFIIIALLAILVVKLRQAFSMQTVTAKQQTLYDLQPRMTTLSTYQNDPKQAPYMLAVQLTSQGCTTATYFLSASMISFFNNSLPSWYTVTTPITLEPCTAEHMVNIPQLWEQAETLRIRDWYCLPLNRTFQIGGNVQFSPEHHRIDITIQCQNSCTVSACGSAVIYQLASKINPQNYEQPFQYYLQQNFVDLSQHFFNQYLISLTENILTTDHSVLPFESKTEQNSFSIEPIIHEKFIIRDYQTNTNVRIQRSGQTVIVDRRYLKLIDVLSYVGGIFPSLFGIFFFMSSFGVYFFEMAFAYQHFKVKETRYIHFGQFLKHNIYKVFGGCRPVSNWKFAKKQCEINVLVNKMLDINYLYRRIQFLESAISVLLDDHQLKGVYLSHVTLKKADQYWTEHRIRNRVVMYLHNKKAKQKQNDIQNDKGKKHQITEEVEPNKLIEKDLKKNISMENIHEPKEQVQVRKKEQLMDEPLKQNDGEDNTLPPYQKDWLLDREYSMLHELGQEDLDEAGLKEEMRNDLKKLFRQANKAEPNQVSRRIINNIDEWLRIEINDAIEEEQQKDNIPYEIIMIKKQGK